MAEKRVQKRRMGRPPKFEGPKRPVTVTLPERTLQELAAVDSDRARAIVRVARQATAGSGQMTRPVETLAVGPRTALILVRPSRVLKRIPWLRLVEVAPDRFLMAVDSGTTIEKFELQIRDLLDELPAGEEYERGVLTALHKVMSSSRRDRSMFKAEILLVHGGR